VEIRVLESESIRHPTNNLPSGEKVASRCGGAAPNIASGRLAAWVRIPADRDRRFRRVVTGRFRPVVTDHSD